MDVTNRKRKRNLTGVEHSFLGLSPTFWSNVPLLNSDVTNLAHKNGVDCIVISSKQTTRKNTVDKISPRAKLHNQSDAQPSIGGSGKINDNQMISKQNNDYVLLCACERTKTKLHWNDVLLFSSLKRAFVLYGYNGRLELSE